MACEGKLRMWQDYLCVSSGAGSTRHQSVLRNVVGAAFTSSFFMFAVVTVGGVSSSIFWPSVKLLVRDEMPITALVQLLLVKDVKPSSLAAVRNPACSTSSEGARQDSIGALTFGSPR
eukprot:7389470-Prymnesium_polylepis.2